MRILPTARRAAVYIQAALFCLAVCSLAPAGAVEYRYEYAEEPVHDNEINIASVEDLATLAAQSEGKIIMIEFSTAWCAYCEALEQQVLQPMIVSGDYDDRLVIRKLEANDYSKVTGFDGKPYISENLALKYHIKLYPTLVFFDHRGREIGERIVGITVLDYIGHDIDKAIEALSPAPPGS